MKDWEHYYHKALELGLNCSDADDKAHDDLYAERQLHQDFAVDALLIMFQDGLTNPEGTLAQIQRLAERLKLA